jgi:hypothetical protein
MGSMPGPSIFGVDTEVQDTSHADYLSDIPAAKRLGARYDHITLGPGTGTGKFAAADYEVREARRNHIGVILSFGGVATSCSLPTSNVHACPPTTAVDLARYRAYVRKVLLRYRHVVQYFESWTEPNNRSSWLPGPDPALYAALLRAQYSVLTSVNTRYHLHLKLLFGSPTGFQIPAGTPGWIGVVPFTSGVLNDLNGAHVFDGVALHAYRFPPATDGPSTPVCDFVGGVRVTPGFNSSNCPSPDWRWLTWPQELAAYDQLFADHGYGEEPLWLTEFGWPGNPQARGGYFPDYAAQAADLGEAYLDLLALPFVQAAMWFNIRDYDPALASGDPGFFYHYGLLNFNFSGKPAASVFSALAKAFPGR